MERKGRRRGAQATFLWPQLWELQSLKCSAVSVLEISGHVTNEIKQHDMSVFWIKEETSNQHAGVYTTSLPPSFLSSLHPSLWLTVSPSVVGMTPSLSLYLPLFVHHWPVKAGIWGWGHRSLAWQRAPGRDGPVIWTLWWLPQNGAPPSLIGLAWLRFGLEPPYLLCMSIENTSNSLAACLGHARVSKTDRVWSGSKIGRESWKLAVFESTW